MYVIHDSVTHEYRCWIFDAAFFLTLKVVPWLIRDLFRYPDHFSIWGDLTILHELYLSKIKNIILSLTREICTLTRRRETKENCFHRAGKPDVLMAKRNTRIWRFAFQVNQDGLGPEIKLRHHFPVTLELYYLKVTIIFLRDSWSITGWAAILCYRWFQLDLFSSE